MREKSWTRKSGESSGANGGNLEAEGKARKNGIRLRYKSGGAISTAIQSPRRAGFSFLVISFTSENNCLVRVFPLFSPPQPTRALLLRVFSFAFWLYLHPLVSPTVSPPRTAAITNYLQFRPSPGVRAAARECLQKKGKKEKIPFNSARAN